MNKNNKTNKTVSEITTDYIKLFKHNYNGRIQFSEVDSFGVAHNIKYFYWLEWARSDYLNSIGINMNPLTFLKEHPLMTVHAEVDYIHPAKFFDEYNVATRIAWIKNSSLCFENLIFNNNGEILLKASAVLVNVNPKTGESHRISDELRAKIIKFEGEDIKILDLN